MERSDTPPNGSVAGTGVEHDQKSTQTSPFAPGEAGKLWADTVARWREELDDEEDLQSNNDLQSLKSETPASQKKKKEKPFQLSDIPEEDHHNMFPTQPVHSTPDGRIDSGIHGADRSMIVSIVVEPPKSTKGKPVPLRFVSPGSQALPTPPAPVGPSAPTAASASTATSASTAISAPPESAKPSRKNAIKFLKQRTNKREEGKAEDWYRKK